MQLLTGILLDVSKSMEANATGESSVKGGEWSRSIVEVVDELIKHDVSKENKVFAVGVGANVSSGTLDILGTLKKFRGIASVAENTYDSNLESIYCLLEKNGAKSIRKWAETHVIKRAVSEYMASHILYALRTDDQFVKAFVNDCLPPICKNWVEKGPRDNLIESMIRVIKDAAQSVYSTAVSTVRYATESDVNEVVEKAKNLLLKQVTADSIIGVQDASEILRGSVGETELTQERTTELMDAVEPYIYGQTPMYKALEEITGLFSCSKYHEYEKLLFVLSDGQPTDYGSLESVVAKLDKVAVVSCYISKKHYVTAKTLYNMEHVQWEDGAKFHFRLSSAITTQKLPRTIFVKRDWTIEKANNETKLFVHVNHPENIRDVCDLARSVVCSQDALSDLLVSLSLDDYINQSTSELEAPLQIGGTCYANASAAVLHLAMKRILGREGGYPDFETLKQDMIDQHGRQGANAFRVLTEICPRYRLHCQKVDTAGALKAITEKRPVVVMFALTDQEWSTFKKFFKQNPNEVLTTNEINIRSRTSGLTTTGHAVVLTSFNSKCLHLMNSWGSKWADMGFFRVSKAEVLDMKYVDVYWTSKDLTNGEKDYYRMHGSDVSAKLMHTLVGLQKATHTCPICHESSLVTEFSGDLVHAKCPRCSKSFRYGVAGNSLALNLYLLSLSR